VSYATDLPNLCSSLQLFESLQRLHAKPDRILLYPGDLWNVSDTSSQNTEARLLRQAGIYGAKLQPIALTMASPPPAESAWANSFAKLLAFNQTQYRRVLALDSDSTILQNLDHLFLLPPEVEIAMPRAYWESSNTFMMPHSPKLCSSMILLTPSEAAFNTVQWHTANRGASDYDMEIVNKLFYSSSSDSVTMILPHRGYILLTGEFRESNHSAYLGDKGKWSTEMALEEAHYVHFSDFPLPKPWAAQSYELLKSARPECGGEGRQDSCEEREAWDWLYRDFRQRRRNVCGSEFETWLEVESEMEVARLLGDVPTGTTTVGEHAVVETAVVAVA
ncbi:glycosyltransferase family 8 protein, partial [Pseudocercospora fijiensis CIRAD86]